LYWYAATCDWFTGIQTPAKSLEVLYKYRPPALGPQPPQLIQGRGNYFLHRAAPPLSTLFFNDIWSRWLWRAACTNPTGAVLLLNVRGGLQVTRSSLSPFLLRLPTGFPFYLNDRKLSFRSTSSLAIFCRSLLPQTSLCQATQRPFRTICRQGMSALSTTSTRTKVHEVPSIFVPAP
jgi:hypothetical protein